MINVLLKRLNKKNGQMLTAEDLDKVDSNATIIQDTLNNLSIIKSQDFTITASSWQKVSDNKYTLIINHNLNSKSIICQFYNSLGEQETLGIKKVDLNNLLLTNTETIDGEITIIVA